MSSLHEPLLQYAKAHAKAGRFAQMLEICKQMEDNSRESAHDLLNVGALLLSFGFLARASTCFERVRTLAPADLRPLVNLANLARESGNHAESQRHYSELRSAHSDHAVIQRNFLVSQEYDPVRSDAERMQHIQAWGGWAIALAGGLRCRPSLSPLAKRRLRVGYVSADLCHHTVGLFLNEVLSAHDPKQLDVFAYSAGNVNDMVTASIRNASTFHDVSALNDADLATLIQQDHIDILVDLSGHTAGSRLTVFARRPAPVQVSWLGYFASTGLQYMDAVLLDGWHAPPGTEAQFVEPIVRLPHGRFCYQPQQWAPAEVAELPHTKNGYITFK